MQAANDNRAATRPAEFDRLLVAHLPALKKRIRKLSKVGHEDIASDTIALALRSWRNFDPAKGGVYTWLMFHARYAAYTYRVKMQSRWDIEVLTGEMPRAMTAPDQIDSVLLQEVLAAATDRNGRAAVYVGLGYTMKELGEIESLHPVYANACARQGREALREFVGIPANDNTPSRAA